MDRRWTLAAVWALFAAASVGVGFGAAGLAGDPFGDSGQDSALTPVFVAGPTPSSATTRASSAHQPSRTPSSGHSTSHDASPVKTASPTRSASHGPSGADSSEPVAEPAVRSVTTRGGYVAGSCRRGLVTVSASPAVGWRIDQIDRSPTEEATVKFRQSSGDGEVEVHATCSGGEARFVVGDDRGTSGRGGGDG
jgi:hypothetical protein